MVAFTSEVKPEEAYRYLDNRLAAVGTKIAPPSFPPQAKFPMQDARQE